MNITQDEQTEEPENVEETLRTFLERDTDYCWCIKYEKCSKVHRCQVLRHSNGCPELDDYF